MELATPCLPSVCNWMEPQTFLSTKSKCTPIVYQLIPSKNFHFLTPLEMTRLSIIVKGWEISLPNTSSTGRKLPIFQLGSTWLLGNTPGLAALGDNGVPRAFLSHGLSVGACHSQTGLSAGARHSQATSSLIGVSSLLYQPLTSTGPRSGITGFSWGLVKN